MLRNCSRASTLRGVHVLIVFSWEWVFKTTSSISVQHAMALSTLMQAQDTTAFACLVSNLPETLYPLFKNLVIRSLTSVPLPLKE